MTYVYKCDECNLVAHIDKPMAEVDRVEHCEICESELKRVYIVPAITTADGFKHS